ncbi:TOTE conflict system archaeo-eukaryotic primase domain-containing protein [Metabacillus litoralis]|uniref:TOTE conflict system archaeo-eukaryotic primase domain-containing protein n=1 Tax=Metabacillus litoralis TaxID=152268 RepID=UPI00203E710D|nr:DEAD/DEAH box helicase [Metabacillus litoralis]MCM3163278.1 DEAD/DEAH box helicase [Metabacillus litoralis]
MDTLEERLYKKIDECNRLQEENRMLKELLRQHNIHVDSPAQRNDVLNSKQQKIQERLILFKKFFKGRNDVYAVRWESTSGKSGYSPACEYEWHPTICKKPAIKCNQCQHRKLVPLTDKVLYDHLTGKATIGIYPLLENEACWFLAVDFDKKSWQEDVSAFYQTCKKLKVPASIERSRSGKGCHVWIFFESPIPASLARKLGNSLLELTLETRYELGLDSYDRLFPNQDTLPSGGFGNLIALPLQGKPRKEANSVFIDENFKPFFDQWEFLSNIKRMKKEEVLQVTQNRNLSHDSNEESSESAFIKPEKVNIILKNGLYINKEGLSSSLLNKLVSLGTFRNPEFYKAQAKRMSTHGLPRMINCSDIQEEYVVVPRGCFDQIEELFKEQKIEAEIHDMTNRGVSVPIQFTGVLRSEQVDAVSMLAKSTYGTLAATTGFGKTVVAAALIAKRGINTLIIVHRKQLIEQWKERLSSFFAHTDNIIGQIGGGKNKATGKIDIATIQSLNHNGTIKDIVKNYGQVIVDECHHISAYSFEKVLKEVEATYVHGLTATPTRKDGLHPIMNMQLGPIRYKVSAKDQAKIRPFEHILIPKYTNFKSNSTEEGKDIQKIYSELINNQNRNEMIFNDILTELEKGSVPLILTERIEHVSLLVEMLKGFAKNIITLTGGMSKKEEKDKFKTLNNVKDNEEMVIVATGKYIGEGFDYSRLDTLFLVMPLSWKGTLQQYVGRLHRLHDNKTKVKVYDYVDHKEHMLKAMFEKRMKGYHALGYKVLEEEESVTQMKLF